MPALRLIPLLALLLLASCAGREAFPQDGSQGTLLEPPVALSDFTLPSSAGGTLSLSELRGRPVLVFFGFTFCPDICPTTLSEFRRVKERLGADGDRPAYLFISVDPERDTPEVLARYVGGFDPAFIGLQGDEATLRRIGREFGLYYQRAEVADSSAGYLMDHSSASYLIDAEGQMRVIYSYGTAPEVIAAGVERLLRER